MEDQGKLEWLRSAIQAGIDDIEAGNFTTLRSPDEIEEFMHRINEEALRNNETNRNRV